MGWDKKREKDFSWKMVKPVELKNRLLTSTYIRNKALYMLLNSHIFLSLSLSSFFFLFLLFLFIHFPDFTFIKSFSVLLFLWCYESFLDRPSHDVFLLPHIPWVGHGGSILLVTLLYHLRCGQFHESFLFFCFYLWHWMVLYLFLLSFSLCLP